MGSGHKAQHFGNGKGYWLTTAGRKLYQHAREMPGLYETARAYLLQQNSHPLRTEKIVEQQSLGVVVKLPSGTTDGPVTTAFATGQPA